MHTRRVRSRRTCCPSGRWHAGALAFALLFVPSARGVAQSSGPAWRRPVSGDVWSELDGGKIVRGAGATVYLWEDTPEVAALMGSACAIASADPVAWLVARTVMNDPEPPAFGGAGVVRAVEALRAIGGLPHLVVTADSAGHFVFPEVPAGLYWIEAEMVRSGKLVQWWKRISLLGFRIAGDPGDASAPLALGPADERLSQFCISFEEPRDSAAAPVAAPPATSDRVYEEDEVDVKPRALGSMRSGLIQMWEGTLLQESEVIVRFVVDADGRVDKDSFQILHEPYAGLGAAVREGVLKTTFAPGLLHGRPVRVAVKLRFATPSIGPRAGTVPGPAGASASTGAETAA